MNVLRATTTRMLTVRPLEAGDLPRLLQIEQQAPVPRWTQLHLKTDLRAGDRINLVAAIRDYPVGYAIAQLVSPLDPLAAEARTAARPSPRSTVPPPLVHLQLLHIAVASDWARRGIGQTLVQQFDPFLRQPDDLIQAAVPETNLPAQLLLRSAGYRAQRVLYACYGSEDAYLMERRRP
jgi:ribosomal protein S18 acetylase RimI-like enzyme